MKRFLPSGLFVFAGVLGIATATASAQSDVTKVQSKPDLRESILRRFFKANRAPIEEYAGVFLREADAFSLDWRLLPSLSIVESGGGKRARGNNLFGWANGATQFESIGEAIHHVASALSLGRPYRGKNLSAKLWAYNPRAEYNALVTGVMRQIAPSAILAHLQVD